MNTITKNLAPQILKIGDLLSKEHSYVVPMYQRNYAWGEAEVTQLSQDIIDTMTSPNTPYYIGTLVLHRRDDSHYEVIDGQQRLTTLALLTNYLRHHSYRGTRDKNQEKNIYLLFESRPRSQRTFDALHSSNDTSTAVKSLTNKELNRDIERGYLIIKDQLPKKLDEHKKNLGDFNKFLNEQVTIAHVVVPSDTNLNHYFEIMNNRGEQLEKHEILKARMLEKLSADVKSTDCLSSVWEACSNMEGYIQQSFKTKERTVLFGDDWNYLVTCNFESISYALSESANQEITKDATPYSIKDLTTRNIDKPIERTLSYGSSNYSGVVNFPNFLLQVLRVYTRENVSLDDKNLLKEFDIHIFNEMGEAEKKIKAFTFALLRCRLLLDTYVIKRETVSNKSTWSLKQYIKDSNATGKNIYTIKPSEHPSNQSLRMLTTAMHVSFPTQSYKHWLTGAIDWLYRNTSSENTNESHVCKTKYLNYLESLAQSFVFDRYLAKPSGDISGAAVGPSSNKDGEPKLVEEFYYTTIFNSKKLGANKPTNGDDICDALLKYGHIASNFIFNYLDYLLWLESAKDGAPYANFEFTFRSSVEHHYPQNPINESDLMSNQGALHSFGNLCLISHAKNSKLTNLLPEGKKSHYTNGDYDSLKQGRMMAHQGDWSEAAILSHNKEMKELLAKTPLSLRRPTS